VVLETAAEIDHARMAQHLFASYSLQHSRNAADGGLVAPKRRGRAGGNTCRVSPPVCDLP